MIPPFQGSETPTGSKSKRSEVRSAVHMLLVTQLVEIHVAVFDKKRLEQQGQRRPGSLLTYAYVSESRYKRILSFEFKDLGWALVRISKDSKAKWFLK